jgi:hypothetical protein
MDGANNQRGARTVAFHKTVLPRFGVFAYGLRPQTRSGARVSQNSTVFQRRPLFAFLSKAVLRQPFGMPRNPAFLRELPRDMRGNGATGRGFSVRDNDWLRDVLNVEARNSPIFKPEDVTDRFIL